MEWPSLEVFEIQRAKVAFLNGQNWPKLKNGRSLDLNRFNVISFLFEKAFPGKA